MRIFIVRHGDKEKGDYFNARLNHQDSPISEEGRRKAKRLADYFEHKLIKKVIVSEYLRADQTAQYIAEQKGLHILKDGRLNEIDNGVIESMTDEEIKDRYPEFWNDFFSYSKDVRFPEGENSEEVKARQKNLLDELIQNNEDVLLISHEGYIRLLICHLLGIPLFKRNQFYLDMCGITELDYNKDTSTWKLIRFNHTLE